MSEPATASEEDVQLGEDIPRNYVDANGDRWTTARAKIAAGTWGSLGALEFPPATEDVVFVAGVIAASYDGLKLWCPAVRSGWVPVQEFVEATKGVKFGGNHAIWARNESPADVEFDVRVRFREGGEPPSAPDDTAAYYGSQVWKRTTWFGSPVLKCPLDLWIMQEILFEVRPRLVIEAGTFHGGSAAYFACLLDMIHGDQDAKVYTVDVEEKSARPSHPRITYERGSSLDREALLTAAACADALAPVVVVLDSDHAFDHVLAELRAYAPLVTPGSYLVVEDTNSPGPAEAVREFLASPEGAEFSVDRSREKFGTSFNKGGWLKKNKGDEK